MQEWKYLLKVNIVLLLLLSMIACSVVQTAPAVIPEPMMEIVQDNQKVPEVDQSIPVGQEQNHVPNVNVTNPIIQVDGNEHSEQPWSDIYMENPEWIDSASMIEQLVFIEHLFIEEGYSLTHFGFLIPRLRYICSWNPSTDGNMRPTTGGNLWPWWPTTGGNMRPTTGGNLWPWWPTTGGNMRPTTGGNLWPWWPTTGGNMRPTTGGNLWPWWSTTGGNMRPVTGGNLGSVTGGNMQPVTGGNLGSVTGGNMRPVTGGNLGSVTGGNMRPVTGGNLGSVTGGNMRPVTGGNLQPNGGGGLRVYWEYITGYIVNRIVRIVRIIDVFIDRICVPNARPAEMVVTNKQEAEVSENETLAMDNIPVTEQVADLPHSNTYVETDNLPQNNDSEEVAEVVCNQLPSSNHNIILILFTIFGFVGIVFIINLAVKYRKRAR